MKDKIKQVIPYLEYVTSPDTAYKEYDPTDNRQGDCITTAVVLLMIKVFRWRNQGMQRALLE